MNDLLTDLPLVVDLDGSLICSDLLVESAFAYLGDNPLHIFSLLYALRSGKAAIKSTIAAETAIDVTQLPYDERVLELIAEARARGRKIYIASASAERYVIAVAEHVGADGYFASDRTTNLSRERKAECLVDAFGERGFDYVGNDTTDLPVWNVCRKGWAIHPPASARKAIAASCFDVDIIPPPERTGPKLG
ncbi:haloacid dehalogenase-like hydrolase [Rhodopseudomonas sp. G2_2311]|uniref:haloacid dehalogenase-like hydrolase n=1 Tax=Rhodopseudomonas sp. G2_2311 TaxID=3114287 RepID=UPI0039C65180